MVHEPMASWVERVVTRTKRRCDGYVCRQPSRDIFPGQTVFVAVASPWFQFNPRPGHWTRLYLHGGCGT